MIETGFVTAKLHAENVRLKAELATTRERQAKHIRELDQLRAEVRAQTEIAENKGRQVRELRAEVELADANEQRARQILEAWRGWWAFHTSSENCMSTIVDVFTEMREQLEDDAEMLPMISAALAAAKERTP